MNIEPDKLKSLAKDEDAYKQLKNIFSGESNLGHFNFLDNTFEDVFWVFNRREPEKKLTVSKSAEKITGYSPEELTNRKGGIFSIVHEDDVPGVKKAYTDFETDRCQTTTSLSYRILCKNQKVKWVKEIISAERNINGKIINLNSLICDVTSIKAKEEKLVKENDSLLEINKAKDRFISIVSHDLRAPFTSLLGFSEILLNEKDLPEEEKDEYLNYIHDASKNQLQMINYLLEWSRLQTGRVIPEIRRLELKTVVSTCIASLIGNAIRKDIELKQEIEGGIFIQADEKLISQAVSNLISNAIKFTPKNKSVTVTANKYKEGFIEIIVKDQGIGIGEDDQEKLFKIDQKFSLQGTDGEKGSGLGLTLVKEIVERHNGNIWFYSKENEGTEFHFTVPEAKNIILLVEDDQSLMGLYRKLIKKEFDGYEIIQSLNGYEAMSMVMNSLPTVVITDHDMPLMNGIQLVEAIRKKDKNYTVPVIVISAKLNDELRQKYENYGVSKILEKPVEPEELVVNMKELVF